MMEQKESIGWIGTSGEPGSIREPELVYFRKVLPLEEQPENFSIEITADSRYKFYVNGSLVNAGPQKGDRQIWYRDRLELGTYLRKGRNILIAVVLMIPDRNRGGNYSFARTATPGFYLSGLEGFRADESWKWRQAPVKMPGEDSHFAPLHIFEEAEGSDLNGPAWDKEYDDGSWQSAHPYTPFDLSDRLLPENLQERTIPFMRREDRRFSRIKCLRKSRFSADRWDGLLREGGILEIPPESREIVEISAGEERTGFLKLLTAGGKDSRITLLTSECYAYEPIEGLNGPVIPRKGDRTDSERGQLYGFTDTYRVKGAGTTDSPEIYEPFWFRTFRYIRLTIETAEEPLTLADFSYQSNAYPLEVKTSVETSDPSLAKIWEISERSLRLCMHETYEDCPFYEQLQYAQDTRSQILYTYAVSADDRLARQAMDDFRRSARFDGMVNCSFPNYENHVIPGFGIFYIAMVYDHMMYFGDKELIREHMPAILGVLNFFRKHIDEKGLVGKVGGPLFSSRFWSFIDWTDQWRDTLGVPPATGEGPLTMESFYYVMALRHGAALFDYLGFSDLSRRLMGESEEIKAAINRHCRGENGMYQDGPSIEAYSQHCQVFALLTDSIDGKRGKKNLLETFSHKEKYAQCSVAMMYYLFRALEKCGAYEKTDGLWNIWRDMVKKNLTTCEEDSVLSRSDCHAWGALVLYELPSAVLGVRPASPGYAELEIHPMAGALSWARGTVCTPRGPVHVSWKKENGEIKLEVSPPEGVKVRTSQGS